MHIATFLAPGTGPGPRTSTHLPTPQGSRSSPRYTLEGRHRRRGPYREHPRAGDHAVRPRSEGVVLQLLPRLLRLPMAAPGDRLTLSCSRRTRRVDAADEGRISAIDRCETTRGRSLAWKASGTALVGVGRCPGTRLPMIVADRARGAVAVADDRAGGCGSVADPALRSGTAIKIVGRTRGFCRRVGGG